MKKYTTRPLIGFPADMRPELIVTALTKEFGISFQVARQCLEEAVTQNGTIHVHVKIPKR